MRCTKALVLGALFFVPLAAACDSDSSGDGDSGGDAGAMCGSGPACSPGQACRYDACVPNPPFCSKDDECLGDTWCDEPQMECLPFGVGPVGEADDTCRVTTQPGVFFPGVQCEWLGPPAGDPYPEHKNVLSAPMVADLAGGSDPELGRPSIVLVSYNFTDGGAQSCSGTDPAYFGVIRILDGRTCQQLDSIATPTVIASASVALAQLDGQGGLEIVAARSQGGLVAFTRGAGGWGVLWETPSTFADAECNWGGPSIHDLNDDGKPEVLLYGAVYDTSGVPLDESLVPAALDPASTGYIPVVADVDADGLPELVTGAQIYAWDLATTAWVAEGPPLGVGGRVAVADFGSFGADPMADDRGTLDGIAEVVTIDEGVAYVHALSGRQIFSAPLQGSPAGSGGPPTIADFDGDGRAEFASAGGTAYTVFDLDCLPGQPMLTPDVCPSDRTDGVAWSQPSKDQSSNVTGSSVFDFEGDGRAEVVYGDECFTRVYDGVTGQVMYSRYRTSCTWYENPIVVDSDADYNAEILITSNTNCNVSCPAVDPIFDGVACRDDGDCPATTSCGREQPADALGRCRCDDTPDCGGDGFVCLDPIAGPSAAGKVCRAEHGGPGTASGVRVIADGLDRWVNTRKIWNQHAYAVTNVDEQGRIPRTSLWKKNWAEPGLNNFRQNTPGDEGSAGSSPDLTIKGALATCAASGSANVNITLCNRGTEPVADGLSVAVYAGTPPAAPLACVATTMVDLRPGMCIPVTCTWATAGGSATDLTIVADDAGDGSGSANLECREANNSFVLAGVACP